MRHDPRKACLHSVPNLIIIRLGEHTSGSHLEPFSKEGRVDLYCAVHGMANDGSDDLQLFAGMAERGFRLTRAAGAGSGPILYCMRLYTASKSKY